MMIMMHITLILHYFCFSSIAIAFSLISSCRHPSTFNLEMSFYADSSDYKSSDSDYSSDDQKSTDFNLPIGSNEGDERPSVDESPVPMSKNSGNRFLAFIFDKLFYDGHDEADVIDLHENRIGLTEEHVLFCRRANLYNETFNFGSMSDVLWSNQLLSSDLKRTVGHVICVESTSLEHAKDLLSRDPIIQMLTGGDISSVPFFRWRQIRDYTLRQDDGRDGLPTLLIAMDHSSSDGVGNLREELRDKNFEYLIRSNRIIATGSLHLPTELKDDPSSKAVGDFMLFNAKDRVDAIAFVENSPSALEGLYSSMRVHRFNSLDVTGKFVATNIVYPHKSQHTEDLKEAMDHWGYPVHDDQTKWLNW